MLLLEVLICLKHRQCVDYFINFLKKRIIIRSEEVIFESFQHFLKKVLNKIKIYISNFY